MPKIDISESAAKRLTFLVESGVYETPEDAVESSIAMLQTDEEKLASLRHDIQRGLDDIEAGRVEPFDAEKIKREGRERLKQPQG